jgi:hypothetical protein
VTAVVVGLEGYLFRETRENKLAQRTNGVRVKNIKAKTMFFILLKDVKN